MIYLHIFFKAQVVIKATLFFTVMNLILEAINYYYYYMARGCRVAISHPDDTLGRNGSGTNRLNGPDLGSTAQMIQILFSKWSKWPRPVRG